MERLVLEGVWKRCRQWVRYDHDKPRDAKTRYAKARHAKVRHAKVRYTKVGYPEGMPEGHPHAKVRKYAKVGLLCFADACASLYTEGIRSTHIPHAPWSMDASQRLRGRWAAS